MILLRKEGSNALPLRGSRWKSLRTHQGEGLCGWTLSYSFIVDIGSEVVSVLTRSFDNRAAGDFLRDALFIRFMPTGATRLLLLF